MRDIIVENIDLENGKQSKLKRGVLKKNGKEK
jgi:hypothetical protein